MRKNPTTCNGRLDKQVQFVIPPDRQLNVPRDDTLEPVVPRGIACQLQYLGGEILEDGRCVDGGGGADAFTAADARLEQPVHAADGELEARPD